jgi:hypothetical protein
MTITLDTVNKEKEKVRLNVVIYLYEHDKAIYNPSTATKAIIHVLEERYIKQTVEDRFSDEDVGSEVLEERTLDVTVLDELDIPYSQTKIEVDSFNQLNDILYLFIKSFTKGVHDRSVELYLHNPISYPNYTISENTIKDIFETFSYVYIDMDRLEIPILFPKYSFKNNQITIKNTNIIVEQTEFSTDGPIVFDTCVFNKKVIDDANYISLNSHTSITFNNNVYKSLLYTKLFVANDNKKEWETTFINCTATYFNFEDLTLPKSRDAIVSLSGARILTVSDTEVNGDIPMTRILSLSNCESFSIVDYTHNRKNNATFQDFSLSKFMDGKLVNIVSTAPKNIQQGKSLYCILLSQMRNEASFSISDSTIEGLGICNINFTNFNTFKIINTTVKNVDTWLDIVNCSIAKIVFNKLTIQGVKNTTLESIEASWTDCIYESKYPVEFTVNTALTLTRSSFIASDITIILREMSNLNSVGSTLNILNSVVLYAKRPIELSSSPNEVVSLATTKIQAKTILIKSILKLICNDVQFENFKTLEFNTLALIFSNFIIDYKNGMNVININNCTLSNSLFNLKNTPIRYDIVFNNSSGLFNLEPESDLASLCNFKLIKSKIQTTIDQVYGSHTISLNSEDSVGSSVFSSVDLTISPLITCKDKIYFKRATTIKDKDSTKILYGTFVTDI